MVARIVAELVAVSLLMVGGIISSLVGSEICEPRVWFGRLVRLGLLLLVVLAGLALRAERQSSARRQAPTRKAPRAEGQSSGLEGRKDASQRPHGMGRSSEQISGLEGRHDASQARRQRILASIEERAMAARVEQDRQLQFAKLEQATMKLARAEERRLRSFVRKLFPRSWKLWLAFLVFNCLYMKPAPLPEMSVEAGTWHHSQFVQAVDANIEQLLQRQRQLPCIRARSGG